MSKTIVRPAAPALRPKQRVSGFVPASEPTRSVSDIVNSQPSQVEHSNSSIQSVDSFQNDGRYVLLSDLPTEYREYDYKELWIRPFTPNEARLIHMAKVSSNLTYIVSAVAACLSKPVTSLVIEDFEFCLYWLRLNSYPSKPFSVDWTCDLPLLNADGTEPEVHKSCTKKNTSILSKSNLVITSLDSSFVLPPKLMYPTIAIFEEVWALKDRIEHLDESDENFESDRDELLGDIYLVNIAQWIREGSTITDKLNLLKNAPDLSFQGYLEEIIGTVPVFGVSETVLVQCEQCGGTAKRRMGLDYLTFFP